MLECPASERHLAIEATPVAPSAPIPEHGIKRTGAQNPVADPVEDVGALESRGWFRGTQDLAKEYLRCI
jgi:hypothetical protein